MESVRNDVHWNRFLEYETRKQLDENVVVPFDYAHALGQNWHAAAMMNLICQSMASRFYDDHLATVLVDGSEWLVMTVPDWSRFLPLRHSQIRSAIDALCGAGWIETMVRQFGENRTPTLHIRIAEPFLERFYGDEWMRIMMTGK